MLVVRFKYAGLRELKDLLRKLPDSTSKATIRRALKKAAVPIKESAERFAPVHEGDLAASIVISPNLNKRQKRRHRKIGKDDIEMYVGVRSGEELNAYSHIVEFGSSKMAAQPFMTPAFEQRKKEAFDILISETWNELEKSIRRLVKKGKWVE